MWLAGRLVCQDHFQSLRQRAAIGSLIGSGILFILLVPGADASLSCLIVWFIQGRRRVKRPSVPPLVRQAMHDRHDNDDNGMLP